MNWYRTLVRLVYAETCVLCGRPLTHGEEVLCHRCINELPFTGYELSDRHKMARILQAKAPVYKAVALMFYNKNGLSGRLIHKLKYHHHTLVGKRLADFLAPALQSDLPDWILPVPLHPRKKRKRGYNQTEKFARRLAQLTGARFTDKMLIKKYHTQSQTRKSPWERWKNVDAGFDLRPMADLNGRHVLLTDDVVTTGATIGALVRMIREKYPESRVSVASMAFNMPR